MWWLTIIAANINLPKMSQEKFIAVRSSREGLRAKRPDRDKCYLAPGEKNTWCHKMSSEKDLLYFLENLERFREQHIGRYVVISEEKLCAVYMDTRSVEGNARKYVKPRIFHIGENDYEEYTLDS
jgi:hypothetical protein